MPYTVSPRAVGVTYAAVILVSIVNAATLLTSGHDSSAFRAGLVVELSMFLAVGFLAGGLFLLVREHEPELALLGLVWRAMEAAVGVVVVVLGLALARVVAHVDDPRVRETLAEVLLGAREAGLDLVVVCLSLGTAAFMLALWRTRLVPRWLSGWGLASILFMGVVTVGKLLDPGLADLVLVTYLPGGVFELAFGSWLAVRGLATGHTDLAGPTTPGHPATLADSGSTPGDLR